ncbi:hypothetical protein [Pseudomonas aeruginosa]|uniref:hypothetical protein n=1 Tax=Pseudomonas aeruginosa TaxID=287 RepID=UPI00265B1372|nr:hypothetical protein [Pseudomonas aeruginosa]
MRVGELKARELSEGASAALSNRARAVRDPPASVCADHGRANTLTRSLCRVNDAPPNVQPMAKTLPALGIAFHGRSPPISAGDAQQAQLR